jgi:hypothetical protein
MVAVAAAFQEPDLPDQPSREQFINAALEAASGERKKIDAWQKRASIASGAGAALTVFALVAALVVDPPSAARAATVYLTPAGRAALMTACPNVSAGIVGKVDAADLERELVPIQATNCEGLNAVSVPRGHIAAVVFEARTND